MHSFFFIMRRQQPRSTLFPYTTLFRSLATDDKTQEKVRAAVKLGLTAFTLEWDGHVQAMTGKREFWRGVSPRSEEHTSELQSRLHLVCRLLLEKKKKNKNRKITQLQAP